jgi:hypothetical protein
MASLKELVKRSNELEELLYESGGEITEAIEAQLAEMQEKLPTKIDNYAVVIERAEMQVEFLKSKIEALNSIRKGLESLSDRLKENLKDAAKQMNVPYLEGQEYKITVARSKPKVDVTDMSLLTDEYLEKVVTYKVNKEKISEALKNGEQVHGARLIEGYSIRIKPMVKG